MTIPAANPGARPTQALLDELVRRIVAATHPQRIILFGSAARGEMGPNSDLDLLVVAATTDRHATARTVRRALRGLGVAKDVIVVTPEDIERHKDNRGLVLYPALREGKLLYAA
jgi:predicted nucleotidyltransferase